MVAALRRRRHRRRRAGREGFLVYPLCTLTGDDAMKREEPFAVSVARPPIDRLPASPAAEKLILLFGGNRTGTHRTSDGRRDGRRPVGARRALRFRSRRSRPPDHAVPHLAGLRARGRHAAKGLGHPAPLGAGGHLPRPRRAWRVGGCGRARRGAWFRIPGCQVRGPVPAGTPVVPRAPRGQAARGGACVLAWAAGGSREAPHPNHRRHRGWLGRSPAVHARNVLQATCGRPGFGQPVLGLQPVRILRGGHGGGGYGGSGGGSARLLATGPGTRRLLAGRLSSAPHPRPPRHHRSGALGLPHGPRRRAARADRVGRRGGVLSARAAGRGAAAHPTLGPPPRSSAADAAAAGAPLAVGAERHAGPRSTGRRGPRPPCPEPDGRCPCRSGRRRRQQHQRQRERQRGQQPRPRQPRPRANDGARPCAARGLCILTD